MVAVVSSRAAETKREDIWTMLSYKGGQRTIDYKETEPEPDQTIPKPHPNFFHLNETVNSFCCLNFVNLNFEYAIT